ncbi:MAG TPA: divalent metal cation transporter [Alphaproteobacteria bacterium]|nr:divalent metal cation transporter [Alphaproteobacteria bacterium]
MVEGQAVAGRKQTLFRSLGPGILLAATAVGVSHLVQSTRAGAVFGLGLLSIVILANAIKYPAFRFSTHYVSTTGHSLLVGYRNISPVAAWIFAIVITPIYCIGVGALSMLTAGLLIALFHLPVSTPVLATIVAIAASAFVVLGHYHWLEVINKWLVLFLAVMTVITAILVLPDVPWSVYPSTAPAITKDTLVFIVALVGYMPAPMETSVLHSLWSVARFHEPGQEGARVHAFADFNIGYIGTTVLAVCFIIMGAGIMHSAGIRPESAAAAFAGQLIGLYSHTLGPVAGVLAGAAAFITILTSLLTVVDGGPRSIIAAVRTARGLSPVPDDRPLDRTPGYIISLTVVGLIAVTIISFLTASFATYLDFGAGVAFVIAPIIAALNHLAVFGSSVPADRHPSVYLRVWSLLGIVVMAGVAVAYLWIRLA